MPDTIHIEQKTTFTSYMTWTLSALFATSPLFGLLTLASPPSPPPTCLSSASNPKECDGVDPDLFLKDKWAVFTNVEFLLWKVNESALDFAIKMNEPAWSSSLNTYAMGKYKNATFGWDPGVRLALGYFNAPDLWDVFAQYTFLHAEGEDTVHAPEASDRFLVGTWIGPDFNDTSTAVPLKKTHSHGSISTTTSQMGYSAVGFIQMLTLGSISSGGSLPLLSINPGTCATPTA